MNSNKTENFWIKRLLLLLIAIALYAWSWQHAFGTDALIEKGKEVVVVGTDSGSLLVRKVDKEENS